MSLFTNLSRKFTAGNKGGDKKKPPSGPSTTYAGSSQAYEHSPSIPPISHSPSFASVFSDDGLRGIQTHSLAPGEIPLFYRPTYSGLTVKGSFKTLAVQPKHVEMGEWIAHQVVSQFQLLAKLKDVIMPPSDKNAHQCNPTKCPTMYCGLHTYAWMTKDGKAVNLPASQYISMVLNWIGKKVIDEKQFPTDPPEGTESTYASSGPLTPGGSGSSTPIAAGPTTLNSSMTELVGRDWVGKASGFPENHYDECKSMFKQMMRVYAHLYWGHWIEPFWHVNKTEVLNTCFIHFVTVGRHFALLDESDLVPMKGLVEVWTAQGVLPNEPSGFAWNEPFAGFKPASIKFDSHQQASADKDDKKDDKKTVTPSGSNSSVVGNGS